MTRWHHAVPRINQVLSRAAARARDSHNQGDIVSEPDCTSRMLGRMEQAAEGLSVDGFTLRAHVMGTAGQNSEERVTGADFRVSLAVIESRFTISKGFLAQAKRVASYQRRLSSADSQRLLRQCDAMLGLSADSFVFLYSPRWIRIVPAIDVLGTDGMRPWDLAPKTLPSFLRLFLDCFVGDRDQAIENVEADRLTLALSATEASR